uniref:Photosystem I reaction center subunit VIII n=1 Tax=Capparis spinosa var. herbacea TaxID=2717819 RepID=A0A6G8IZN6_CAPSN|nr:photosystem I subunit I [Capparis spinosa var. herbacea]QIM59146.1 photosystem I subunit I [Capparis spinosa var. herbacea]
MTTFNILPSIFVPLVGLIFPAIAMASLFLDIQKIRFFRSDET